MTLAIEQLVCVQVQGASCQGWIGQVMLRAGGQVSQHRSRRAPGWDWIKQPQRVQPVAVPGRGCLGHSLGVAGSRRVTDGLEGRGGGCGRCISAEPVAEGVPAWSVAFAVLAEDPPGGAGQVTIELHAAGSFFEVPDSRETGSCDLLCVVDEPQRGLSRDLSTASQ